MSKLFQESSIAALKLKNRFVRSATWEGLATESGAVTPALQATMATLAEGGVGLVISSHAYVSKEGQGTPRQLGVYDNTLVAGLSDLVTTVHDHGGRIALQLAHAGIHADRSAIGCPPLAVSGPDNVANGPVRILTTGDIDTLVAEFAKGATRARTAGFDAIQIHAAHGYLLSQFLSPDYNRRTDNYGGSIVNRSRIHLRIIEAVRDAAGPDLPILIKMNCADFHDGGLNDNDALRAAELFIEAGVNAIELSGGIIRSRTNSPSRLGIVTPEKEAYFSTFAKQFKKRITVPLILVGGIRSFTVAERLVDDGVADFIAMSRPLIREPGLVNRWLAGDRRAAACVSDNLCFAPGFKGKGVHCVTALREKTRLS